MARSAKYTALILAPIQALILLVACLPSHAVAQEPTQPDAKAVYYPPQVAQPPGLAIRRDRQLAEAPEINVFTGFSFEDRRQESGINFRHRSVEDATRTYKAVHYDHGNGLAAADVDGDGRHDLLFLTQAGGNELWRNLGDGKFEDITANSNLALPEDISVSASFADIDNDGDPDVYITTVRNGNRLFENEGNGVFRDISEASGTAIKAHSSGVVFFDFDRDGRLDLFVCNVGEYTTELLRRAENMGLEYTFYDGREDAFSGHLYPARSERSILFRNLGNNRFEDVTEATGLIDEGWTGDATAVDLNQDGWLDLYVLNMQGHDRYWQNVEGTRFVDVTADYFPKTPWGSMGVQATDWNNDGRVDLFVTDMHSDMSEHIGIDHEKHKSTIRWSEDHLRSEGRSIYGNAFFEQQADSGFAEISERIGAETYWPWGLSAADLNADGWDDYFVAGSMNYPFRYGVNSVLLNDRGQTLRDAEFIVGVEPRKGNMTAQPVFRLDCSGTDSFHDRCQGQTGVIEVWGALGTRSSVVFDLDDDGDLDIVTNEFNAQPQVLISNLSAQQNDLAWLKVVLRGNSGNRDGLGASVTVKTDQGVIRRWMDGKSGYLSQSLLPLYFGLGSAKRIDEVSVEWLGGKQTRIKLPQTNSQLILTEE